MKFVVYVLVIFPLLSVIGQNESGTDSLEKATDNFYREDQFYAAVGFNLLTNLDNEIKQSGFSGGFDLGVIRDFPVNKTSTLALGVGLGLNINTYNQNMFLGESSDGSDFIMPLADDTSYSTNRFSTHILEVPLQFRWRNSTRESYEFWRVYGGVRLGYLYYFKSTFKSGNNTIIQTDLSALNRFRTTAFLSFGYNLVNIQIKYDIIPLFEGNFTSKDSKIGVNPLRLGFVFYLL